MNTKKRLDLDERMESLSLVIDEMEKYQIQRDKLTDKMVSWKYRTFTTTKQKKEDGNTLKGIIERIDVLKTAGKNYTNQYISMDPLDHYLIKRRSKEVYTQ